MKTIAILPAYNEEKNIGKTIERIRKLKVIDKIIVIDDGSKDKTAEIAKKHKALLIRYENNRGKGYATKIGLNKAISMKPEIIILLDADGQHDPQYIPFFIEAIRNGADYVCAVRDLTNYPFNRKIGNWGLKVLTNLFCPTGIMDTECGYRAFSLEAAKKLDLKSERYELEMDFAYNAWKNKFKIKQIKVYVPIFHSKAAIVRGFKNFFYLVKRRIDII